MLLNVFRSLVARQRCMNERPHIMASQRGILDGQQRSDQGVWPTADEELGLTDLFR